MKLIPSLALYDIDHKTLRVTLTHGASAKWDPKNSI